MTEPRKGLLPFAARVRAAEGHETGPYLPERAYQYPGPPRTMAEWAQQALAAKDAEIAALKELAAKLGTERDRLKEALTVVRGWAEHLNESDPWFGDHEGMTGPTFREEMDRLDAAP